MISAVSFPLRLPAVRIRQTLGEFFAVAISARLLRQIVFLDPTRIASVDKDNFLYRLLGNQRGPSGSRARSIAKYIDTVESAFPNSVILSANYNDQGSLIEEEERRWKIETDECGDHLIIPSAERMASVIDGQHRLLGFDYCLEERRDMQLLCSVYIDLPIAYQAYIFATININQRKVDKSLAYEQFGYNLDDESPESWSPDKLAVFFTRKLNLDPESPLHQHIKIAPLEADLVFNQSVGQSWMISTACVVEGILSLFSSKPMTDRDLLHKEPLHARNRSKLPQDSSPFRDQFKACADKELFDCITEFFVIVQDELWSDAQPRSYIRKTIGVQALFDVFRIVALRVPSENLLKELRRVIYNSKDVDFAGQFFQASGKGRVRVKNVILYRAGLISDSGLPDSDRAEYLGIVN